MPTGNKNKARVYSLYQHVAAPLSHMIALNTLLFNIDGSLFVCKKLKGTWLRIFSNYTFVYYLPMLENLYRSAIRYLHVLNFDTLFHLPVQIAS